MLKFPQTSLSFAPDGPIEDKPSMMRVMVQYLTQIYLR